MMHEKVCRKISKVSVSETQLLFKDKARKSLLVNIELET